MSKGELRGAGEPEPWTEAALAGPVEQAARALCKSRLVEMSSNDPLPPSRLVDAVEVYWPEYVEEACRVIEALTVTLRLAGAEGAPGRAEVGRRLVEAARRALPHWRELAAAVRDEHAAEDAWLIKAKAEDRRRVAKMKKEAKTK